jgi:two-component system, NarL family, nitrate/nitrite sensor histidine kinase NarX
VRLVSAWLVSLSFALAMVSGTLWLSWALEGAAAINDTGSLRMRSIWIGLDLQQPEPDLAAINTKTQVLDDTLSKLIIGDPQRPLRLPNKQDVQQHFNNVQAL